MLDEREFELINIVGAELGANQRDLSRKMNLSLGMTNLLIRRLVTKGYIRIRQLNKKKVEYLLTPQGFAEKMQKSVRYTIKTVHSIGLVKKGILSVLRSAYERGVRQFDILGCSDLAGLVAQVLGENFKEDCTFRHIDTLEEADSKAILLVCSELVPVPAGFVGINVIEELARNQSLMGLAS